MIVQGSNKVAAVTMRVGREGVNLLLAGIVHTLVKLDSHIYSLLKQTNVTN